MSEEGKAVPRLMAFNLGGWGDTGRRRVRNRWFGAVFEGLWENQDGTRTWRREEWPKEVKQKAGELRRGVSEE